MKQKYRYTILFENHIGISEVQFDGEAYYYNDHEGTWHFSDEGGREVIAQRSDVAYFTAEPLAVPYASAPTE